MKLRKMFIIASLVSLLVIISGVIWLLVFPKPVIWSFKESGNFSPIPMFAVFNPFREKQSEVEAEKILNLLRNGDCEKVILNLKYQDGSYKYLCENESSNKLEAWELVYRKDSEKTVELFYRIKRFPDSKYIWNLRIDLEKVEKEWKVTDIGSIY